MCDDRKIFWILLTHKIATTMMSLQCLSPMHPDDDDDVCIRFPTAHKQALFFLSFDDLCVLKTCSVIQRLFRFFFSEGGGGEGGEKKVFSLGFLCACRWCCAKWQRAFYNEASSSSVVGARRKRLHKNVLSRSGPSFSFFDLPKPYILNP